MCTENLLVPLGNDWRPSIATQIGTLAGRYNSQFRHESLLKDSLIVPSYFEESLKLPSSQRLFGLNQVNPVAEKVLGFDVSRGQHTEDTMRLTYSIFQNLSISQPELFNQFISDYTNMGDFTTDTVIRHCVEYMRLHDSATLAFQGAMHGKVKVEGKGYDEDDALLGVFNENEHFGQVKGLIFDEASLAYYKKSGIRFDLLKKIANDAVNGSTPLGSMLKKGVDHPPVDWLSYTARDFYELTRIFNIDENVSFSDKVNGVLSGLEQVSTSLEKDIPITLPQKQGAEKRIEDLISTDIVRWNVDQNGPRLVYDATSIAQLYIMHFILRTSFSGSAWNKGTYTVISNALKEQEIDDLSLISALLNSSEQELLNSNLKNVLPITQLTPTELANPKNLPTSLRGWHYDPDSLNGTPSSIVFRNIAYAQISTIDGHIRDFKSTFPDLIKTKELFESHKRLLLH